MDVVSRHGSAIIICCQSVSGKHYLPSTRPKESVFYRGKREMVCKLQMLSPCLLQYEHTCVCVLTCSCEHACAACLLRLKLSRPLFYTTKGETSPHSRPLNPPSAPTPADRFYRRWQNYLTILLHIRPGETYIIVM